jgi:hypothetical protein
VDRLDLLQYLADAQDGIGKALRFLSKIPSNGAPLVDVIWSDTTRVQRSITDALERVRESGRDDQRAA